MSSNAENTTMNSKIQENHSMNRESKTIRITSINKLNNYTTGNKSEISKKINNTKTNFQKFETKINDDKIKTIENPNYINKRIYFKTTKNYSTSKSQTNDYIRTEIIGSQNNKDLHYNTNEERLYKYQFNSNESNNLIKNSYSNLKYKSHTNIPIKNRVVNKNIFLNDNIIQDLNTFVYNPFNDINVNKSQINENQFKIINQPISPLTLENVKFKQVKNIQKKSKIGEKIKYDSSNKLPHKINRTNQNYICRTEISENLDRNLYNRPKEILLTIGKDKKTYNNGYNSNYTNSEKYNTLLTESASENNNYIYEYFPTNTINDNSYNSHKIMPIDIKENKTDFYHYLSTNNSIEMYNNRNITASPSLNFNLIEEDYNIQEKGNKKTVRHKYFQSFNGYSSGKSKKFSSIIQNNINNMREQKKKQNYNPKIVTGKTEENSENSISNDITENKQIKTCNSSKNEILDIKDNNSNFERIINNRKPKDCNNRLHKIIGDNIDNHETFQAVRGKIYDYNLYNKNGFYNENKDKINKNNSFGNSNNIITKILTDKEKSVIIKKRSNINVNSNKLNDMNLIMKQNLNDNINKKSNPNLMSENAINNYINKKFNKIFNIIDKNNFCNIKTCFKLWKNKSEKFNNKKEIDAKISGYNTKLKNILNNIDIWKKNKMNNHNNEMKDYKNDKILKSDLLKNRRKIMAAKTLTYYENKNFYKSNVNNNNPNIDRYNYNKNNKNNNINNGNSITPQINKIIDSRLTKTDFINGNLNPQRSINNKNNTFKMNGNSFQPVNINKKNNIELINSKKVLGRINNLKNRDSRIINGFKKIYFLCKNLNFRSKKIAFKKIKNKAKTNKRIDGMKKLMKFYIKNKNLKIKKALAKIKKYVNKNKKIESIKKIYNYLVNKIYSSKKNTFKIFTKYAYSIKKIENTEKIYNFLVKMVNNHKKNAINKLKQFSNNKKKCQLQNNKANDKNINVISTSSNKSNNNINSIELNSKNNIQKSIGKKFLNNQIDYTTYSVRIQPTNNIGIIASSPRENSCFTLTNNKAPKMNSSAAYPFLCFR